MPARSAMAAVEENGDFALTKAQLDRRWGGGGRGDHGEAIDGLGNLLSQWRARTTMAMLGRKRGSHCGSALRAVEAREKQWSGECVRAGVGLLLELERATWRPRRCMHTTRRSSPEPVGHGDTDRFLKMAIQCSMTMTDSEYSSCQHG